MTFKDDAETGGTCKQCEKPLIYYMGFVDCFSSTNGHYTIDCPIIVCSDSECDYSEEYYEDPHEYEED